MEMQAMKAKINKVTIQIVQGDMLTLPVDGLVTVTDPNLTVEPRLASLTGRSVVAQTADIGWCDVGSAAITDAGDLPEVRKIIHAVGPRWGEGAERGKLGNVTWLCLSLAEDNGLKSIALPAISVGALGYPVENCATTMLTKIIDFTFEDLRVVRKIMLCLPDEAQFKAFRAEFQRQLQDLRETGEGQISQVSV
jgi:O-acetyl-ADP-ribose deacetylase (regulator of RNase III)